MIRRAACAWG